MPQITPFLWFDSNAEDAANFYLSVFPDAKKVSELRSKGVGPWPEGSVAVVTLELLGQQMTFMNGGPGHPQTCLLYTSEAFCASVASVYLTATAATFNCSSI